MKRCCRCFLTAVAAAWLVLGVMSFDLRAETYSLTLNALNSGATTVAEGGVSEFVLNATAGYYDIYNEKDRYYAYGFQLTGATPYQANQKNYSGVTYTVYMKFKTDSSVSWDAVDPVYFVKDEAISSSVTPQMRWIYAQPAELARVYWKSSGVTPFDGASGKLVASTVPRDNLTLWPVVLGSQTLVVNSKCAGTSTFTVPASCNSVDLFVSGTSVFYTVDGTAAVISGGGSFLVASAAVQVRDAVTVKLMKVIGDSTSGSTLVAVYYQR